MHPQCDGFSQEDYALLVKDELPVLRDGFLCPCCRPSMVKLMIDKLEELDTIFFFAEPVTDEQAPTYRDRIAHPIDLSTISKVCTLRSLNLLSFDMSLPQVSLFFFPLIC